MSASASQGVQAHATAAPGGWAALVLRLLLGLAAFGFIALYLWTALRRIGYPFELEWMEGGSVDHVRRVLAGKPVYARPSLDFVPYLYTPLYYYVCAAVTRVTGVGFFPLRLVSLISSLGCFVVLYLLARRESGSHLIGLVAAGLFAATYSLSGAWWDIARVDSLFLLLLLGALYAMRASPKPAAQVAAGLLVCLSYWTKQQALAVALPAVLAVVWYRRGKALPLVLATLLPLAVGHLLLNRVTNGWYSFYTLQLARSHEIYPAEIVGFWFGDLLPVLAGMMGFSLAYLVAEWRRGERSRSLFYAAALAGALAASWVSRLHVGGYLNVIVPAHATLALLGALGLGVALKSQARYLPIAAGLLGLAQFALLPYSPARYVPTERDAAAGRQFLAKLKAVPGDVWVPAHAFLATRAGKGSYAQMMAISDVLRGEGSDAQVQLRRSIKEAYAAHRFRAVIIDTEQKDLVLLRFYDPDGQVFTSPDGFWPVTGWRIRPDRIYVPKVEARGEQRDAVEMKYNGAVSGRPIGGRERGVQGGLHGGGEAATEHPVVPVRPGAVGADRWRAGGGAAGPFLGERAVRQLHRGERPAGEARAGAGGQ